ncbi:MAG TPA: HAD family phosphatase [Clostridia bacterium]|nr:HAD family phosphatase [Clostridia bacterium]
MIKTIIFDMDGVLINSEPISRKVEKKLYDKYNIPYNETLIESLVGKRIKNYWESIFDYYGIEPIAVDRIAKEHEKMYLALKDEVKLMDQVEKWLNRFKKEGYKIYIASSSHVKIIEEMIQKFGLEESIDGYVGGNLVKRGKPNPDIFEKALEISGMKGNECIVFEDSANGIQAAISAGIKCIGFNNKNQHSQDQSKALLTITEFTEENYERIRRLYL